MRHSTSETMKAATAKPRGFLNKAMNDNISVTGQKIIHRRKPKPTYEEYKKTTKLAIVMIKLTNPSVLR